MSTIHFEARGDARGIWPRWKVVMVEDRADGGRDVREIMYGVRFWFKLSADRAALAMQMVYNDGISAGAGPISDYVQRIDTLEHRITELQEQEFYNLPIFDPPKFIPLTKTEPVQRLQRRAGRKLEL